MHRKGFVKNCLLAVLILLLVFLLFVLTALLIRLFSKQQADSLPPEAFAWQEDWQPFEATYQEYLEKGLPQAWGRKLVLNDLYNLEFDPFSRGLGLIEYSAKYSSLLAQLEESERTEIVQYNIRFLKEMYAYQEAHKRYLECDQELQIDLDLDGEAETVFIAKAATGNVIFQKDEYHFDVLINGKKADAAVLSSGFKIDPDIKITEAKFSLLDLGNVQAILCERTGYISPWPDSADPACDYLFVYQKSKGSYFVPLEGYYSMITPEGHLILNGFRPSRAEYTFPVPEYGWSEYMISDSGIEQVLRAGWLLCYFDDITTTKEFSLVLPDGSEKELPCDTRLINVAYSEAGDLCLVSNENDFGRIKIKYSESGFPLLLPGEEKMDAYFELETEYDLTHNWFF